MTPGGTWDFSFMAPLYWPAEEEFYHRKRSMSTENQEVFENWRTQFPKATISASGFPSGYELFSETDQIFNVDGDIFIYPTNGGLLIIHSDGVWSGDVAPFSD